MKTYKDHKYPDAQQNRMTPHAAGNTVKQLSRVYVSKALFLHVLETCSEAHDRESTLFACFGDLFRGS